MLLAPLCALAIAVAVFAERHLHDDLGRSALPDVVIKQFQLNETSLYDQLTSRMSFAFLPIIHVARECEICLTSARLQQIDHAYTRADTQDSTYFEILPTCPAASTCQRTDNPGIYLVKVDGTEVEAIIKAGDYKQHCTRTAIYLYETLVCENTAAYAGELAIHAYGSTSLSPAWSSLGGLLGPDDYMRGPEVSLNRNTGKCTYSGFRGAEPAIMKQRCIKVD